jgi:hypothetical protein
MTNLKIENLGAEVTCEIKRFYFPAILTSNCPECGEEVVKDGRNQYISWPSFNKPQEVHFYHEAEVDLGNGEKDYIDHEWSETILIKLILEAV